MHGMAFDQPSTTGPLTPVHNDGPPLLRRSSSIWIASDDNDSSHNDEGLFLAEASPSSSPSSRKSWQHTFVILAFTLVLAVAAYFAGCVSARRPLELQLQQAEAKRNALLESQTQLLSEKAELGRLPKDYEELLQTFEAVQEDIEEKERRLKEELRWRSLREEEIVQMFGQLQNTEDDEEEKLERKQRDGMAKLIKTVSFDSYGSDAHEVEFHVRIPENGTSSDEWFVVEVAGFDVMPISSFFFLQQVEHGLWDGTSFVINAPHVLFAEPLSGSKDVNRLSEMEAMGLNRLLVDEYNDHMPHRKYTLGYGRMSEAAGSYFYLNKLDNTHTHKGQACFGRVVKGFDVVDRITSLGTNNVDYSILPVDIVSARLLRSPEDA